MSGRPEITRQQIQSRASSQSFSRGESYSRQDAISRCIRRGDEIEGRCRGSYPEPYRVSARFSASDITATSCTCEYDWGGDCKHIVALLLTYLHEPERFEERPKLHDALLSRTKDDLVDIIEQMVIRYPDLHSIVDRPTPNEVIEGMVTLDTLPFRQELRGAFKSHGYDYYDDDYGDTPDRKVKEVAAVANRFAQRGEWRSAAAIYRTILQEFAELEEGSYYDEDGDLAYAISEVVGQLGDCLKQPTIVDDDQERRASFDALLGVYIWDVNFGGIDIGIDAPDIIVQHVRREDIPAIRQFVEAARERKRSRRYGDWAVEAYNEFLLELDSLDEVDPAIILERLREQGMYHLLVSKLLEMERADEAVAVIREEMTTAYEWTHALNLLVEHGHDTTAQRVAEDILAASYAYELAEWLVGRYKANDDKAGLMRWQLKKMQTAPSAADYALLKSTAQALGQWDTLRPQILKDLERQERYDMLTLAYLRDEEWDLAWDTLPKIKRRPNEWYEPRIDFEVAEASRHARPERAIPVYIKYARKEISHRNRDHYAAAARMLATVQQLYDQVDEIEQWETLIADIRREFKTLPALQDELTKVGLLTDWR